VPAIAHPGARGDHAEVLLELEDGGRFSKVGVLFLRQLDHETEPVPGPEDVQTCQSLRPQIE